LLKKSRIRLFDTSFVNNTGGSWDACVGFIRLNPTLNENYSIQLKQIPTFIPQYISLSIKIRRMKQLSTLLIAVFLFIAVTPTKAQVNTQDSLALVDLYDSIGGPNWTNHTNWLTSKPVSSWYGILLDSNGRVSGIFLSSNQLSGSITSSLCNLTKLTELDLSSNNLNGKIPSLIGNLTSLGELWLDHNQLSGAIPSAVVKLPSLGSLELSYNQFTFAGMEGVDGLFPDDPNGSYYAPQATIPLNYNNNMLSVSVGGTPSNNTFRWYKDGNLVATKVGDSTYTKTSNGAYWVIATNSLAGELTLHSDTIGINTQDSLALVDLYDSTGGPNWTINTNWLTSAPVSSWYGITVSGERVTEIVIGNNNLNGTIPTTVGTITNLIKLNLSVNQLSGFISSSLGNLANLKWLDLSGNQLIGIIPASIANLNNLTHLSLVSNKLSGTIPIWLGSLTNLVDLNLGNNQFNGTIPDTLRNLINLGGLELFLNNLDGTIPSWIVNLTKLNALYLDNNQLSGTIPPSIGKLTNLQLLYLNNNQLTGSIPSSIVNLTDLIDLELEFNQFTFAGMEDVANLSKYATGLYNNYNHYSPQATIPLKLSNNVLSVSVGDAPINNTYQWYQNGNLVATITGDSTYTPTTNGQYYVVATNAVATQLTLYSDTITITDLPIKSINLQAKETNGQVLLQWQTIDEINTASFIIQHSTDGATFSTIATKEAVGSGNNGYSFIDKSPAEGINYYRIKAVDKDGASSFSKVVSVQLTVNRLPLTVIPNPVRDVAMIRGSHIASVQVIDNKGNLVKVISLHDATNPTLSVSNLAAGVYYLHIKTTDGNERVVSFVKE